MEEGLETTPARRRGRPRKSERIQGLKDEDLETPTGPSVGKRKMVEAVLESDTMKHPCHGRTGMWNSLQFLDVLLSITCENHLVHSTVESFADYLIGNVRACHVSSLFSQLMAMQALYLLAMLKDAKNDSWKRLNFTLMHGCMGTDHMSVIMMVALRLAISSPEIVVISL